MRRGSILWAPAYPLAACLTAAIECNGAPAVALAAAAYDYTSCVVLLARVSLLHLYRRHRLIARRPDRPQDAAAARNLNRELTAEPPPPDARCRRASPCAMLFEIRGHRIGSFALDWNVVVLFLRGAFVSVR